MLSDVWLFATLNYSSPSSSHRNPHGEFLGSWSKLPFSTPGDLPNSGMELESLLSRALAGGFFTTSAIWEALTVTCSGCYLFGLAKCQWWPSNYLFLMAYFHKWQIYCCCCSVAQLCLFATPCTAARQASLSFTISWSLLKLIPIESVMPSIHLILCRPLLLLLSIFPSIRSFLMSQLFT